MGLIVLDTTVLSYAVGDDHPLHEPCLRLMDRARVRAGAATTTVEVIQEFALVRSRRRPRGNAADLARTYVQLLAPLLSPTDDELEDGLDLFESLAELGSFDCVLAAVCVRRSATLVSADRGFKSVPGLDCLDPASPVLAALLG